VLAYTNVSKEHTAFIFRAEVLESVTNTSHFFDWSTYVASVEHSSSEMDLLWSKSFKYFCFNFILFTFWYVSCLIPYYPCSLLWLNELWCAQFEVSEGSPYNCALSASKYYFLIVGMVKFRFQRFYLFWYYYCGIEARCYVHVSFGISTTVNWWVSVSLS
jgi:hypothetical protein